MTTMELKPCPHCESPAIRKAGRVECSQCGSTTCWYIEDDHAAKAWNRRAPTPAPEGERDAVLDDLVEVALHAVVPGGAEVWNWLPQADAWTPHQTARDVMRTALEAALSKADQILARRMG